ncbi:GntR family transcriptional regulator [Petroclostridium sp. X23]|uniref:GntR family transcriptional regulator n=1 Tax=Petroclostridium sp. X23 TaxID=3045146 RepID=UPI0024AC9AB2|nr:GntR family transcriptional regulator [Petroclostridium sp. X23]WHH58174.1 GntR family transcriptional regulator [Petroclostridium sp. X23]
MNYQTQTLVDVAYKAIKKDITERVLIPGQKIILRELCERYGISETPIKQALNRLIIERLVESIPRKGMKVRKVQWEEIEELMDIRFMIETHYIKQAIQNFRDNSNIKEKFLENLNEHKKMIENVADVNEYFRNYYLDQEFHKLYVKCSGNKRVVEIYNGLGTHAYAYYVYGRQDKAGMIEGVKEHEAIYDALSAQDETGLRERIEIHVMNAKNNVYQMLKKGER